MPPSLRDAISHHNHSIDQDPDVGENPHQLHTQHRAKRHLDLQGSPYDCPTADREEQTLAPLHK